VKAVEAHGWDASKAALPAWSLPKDAVDRIALPAEWPEHVTREWAFGDSTGKGARVCILDSGVDGDHPSVGGLESAVVISVGENDEPVAAPDSEGDVSGHGTACAGIVRALAPDVVLSSVRVLGASFTGGGNVLLAGLRYAIDQGFDVINMSLSTTKKPFASMLHELADSAYFKRTVLVASAHNMPVESYPWRFSSVISVGSHEEPDPLAFFYNPSPPVEFFGRGVNVEVPWSGGRTLTVSGNSFATPHLSAICALVLAKHPELTPFQLKSVLYLTATNVTSARSESASADSDRAKPNPGRGGP
jgi:subtilisin